MEDDDKIVTKPVDGTSKLTRKFSADGMTKVNNSYANSNYQIVKIIHQDYEN